MKRFKKTDMRRIFGRDGPRQKRKAPTQLLDKFRSPVGLSRAGHRFVRTKTTEALVEIADVHALRRTVRQSMLGFSNVEVALVEDPLTGKLVDRARVVV